MAIGRTFKESLQKCLRSLEIGRSGLGGDGKPWRIGTEVYGDRDVLPRDVISRKLSVPNAERIFFIRHAPIQACARARSTCSAAAIWPVVSPWTLAQRLDARLNNKFKPTPSWPSNWPAPSISCSKPKPSSGVL
jgi:hypothetical protein